MTPIRTEPDLDAVMSGLLVDGLVSVVCREYGDPVYTLTPAGRAHVARLITPPSTEEHQP